MKKYFLNLIRFFKIGIITALCLSGVSCATLQQDVYTYSEDNNYIYNSIEIYEYQFIKLDSEYSLEPQAPVKGINNLLKEITSYINSTKVAEPFLIARLRAFEGLLYKMTGKTREAQNSWQEAYALQKGDSYVQLLSSRLTKNAEEALSMLEGTLIFDSKNAVLQLEKGKLFYQLKQYDQAVAAMDNAFILFDAEGLTDYREVYTPLRNSAWELNKLSGLSDADSKILNGIELPEPLTRRFCARLIWNEWAINQGNLKLLTRYSDKYKKSGKTRSPVPDVAFEDEDFDAILGVVEHEFMELPDGRYFYPDEEVTKTQLISWLKNLKR